MQSKWQSSLSSLQQQSKPDSLTMMKSEVRKRKLFVCPNIYRCKCAGRARVRQTAIRHKRAAEKIINQIKEKQGLKQRVVLPLPSPCKGKATTNLAHSDSHVQSPQSCQQTQEDSFENIVSSGKGTPPNVQGVRIHVHTNVVEPDNSGLSSTIPNEHETVSTHRVRNIFDMVAANEDYSIDFSPPFSDSGLRPDVQPSHNPTRSTRNCTISSLSSGSSSSCGQNLILRSDNESSEWSDLGLISPGEVEITKLDQLFRENPCVIEFWLRHKVTDAAMDDLLRIQCAPYRSWSRVREALYEFENVKMDYHHMCSMSHKRLPTLPSGDVEQCDVNGCSGTVKKYGYIRLWDRLKTRLQSLGSGPHMYKHFREQLNSLSPEISKTYCDVFSGSVFQDTVEKLGGLSAVQNDIFLILSGDGAQPFRSSTYTMWPFVCYIANLAPADRVKNRNILPILCVPGPNQPKDIVSFLGPFLEEMGELSNGKNCTLWNGEEVTVRCHLLILEGDLAALCKFCNVKGYNGLRGCMYCLIRGQCDRHTYFPSYVKRADGRKQRLFRTDALPMRHEPETEDVVNRIEALRSSERRGSVKEMEDLAKEWGIKGKSELFSRTSLIAFRSVPIDYMHLLLINVASELVDLLYDYGWIYGEKEREVEEMLKHLGSGVASETRKPRSLRQRGKFKAEEWKFFVLQSSLVVFDCVLPKDILDGWSYFVRVVEMCGRPRITENDLHELETLSRKFYTFYENTFYDGIPERVGVCKMTVHYILHLADSVRNCGPLLNVSQFPMERFIGETVHGLNATTLAAESVLEHWKFQQSCISYQLRKGSSARILHGVLDMPRYPRDALHVTSQLPELEGILLCHPSRRSTLEEMNKKFDGDIPEMLENLYVSRLQLDRESVRQMLVAHPNVKLWSRMAFRDQFTDESRVVHIGCVTYVSGDESRRNYYVAGEYEMEDGGPDDILVYYGRVFQFIEHRVWIEGKEMVFLLALIDWAVDGLRTGAQEQVFSECGRDDAVLFSNRMIEAVDVIQRHISVVEKVRKIGGHKKLRTYFLDINRMSERLLENGQGKLLRGFRRRKGR